MAGLDAASTVAGLVNKSERVIATTTATHVANAADKIYLKKK